jgi:DNA repair protein RadC
MIVAEQLMKYTKKQLAQMLVSAKQDMVIFPSDMLRVLDEQLAPYKFAEQEHFLVATLNGAHQIINLHDVSKGLVNHTLVHPREVFRPAIADNSVAVIVAHNHPSGNLFPSNDDKNVTKRLKEVGRLLGIEVLDHIVFGPNPGFHSFLEEGEF